MKKIVIAPGPFRLKILLFLFCMLTGSYASAQSNPRTIIPMNQDWKFSKEADPKNDGCWQVIHLPHTWNTDDVLDDEPGYYRGVGWYKKIFTVASALRNEDVSLFFEGANQVTEVFINGSKAGTHIGGYTAFSIPVTPFLKFGENNEVLVKVDNSYNKNVPPLTGDFTFYGGIYRDVYLYATNEIHFSQREGANGVYITTPFVSEKKADVEIKCYVTNNTNRDETLFVTTSILDDNGNLVAQAKSSLSAKRHSEVTVDQAIKSIRHPELWSPDRPYLYKVVTEITNKKGKQIDLVTNPLGFRWFRFDADKGFYLNGQPLKLIGAGRHQDYQGLGNAVPDSLAVEDISLLKKMGANFLRVAHYPQDPCVLRTCDSLGLLASVEIPIINEITESGSFEDNCKQMLKEMIHQNFNHPSVIIWCYMNEVLLKTHFEENKERQAEYITGISALAQRLDRSTRQQDPFRYTMMADHGSLAQYKNAGLLKIPMIVGWNLYSGWYGGSMDDFPMFLDRFHKEFPDKPFMVTEYGADADPRIRSRQPVRFDKSIEYATRFHQFYFMEMMKRPYVAGAIIWNLADFNSETRVETMPHMNNKGLLQWDRKPKDAYYFYKAVLLRTPFIKILGPTKDWFGIADSSSGFRYQQVQVASNFDSVTLILNGRRQVGLKVVDGLCEWRVPVGEGLSTVVAEGNKNGRVYSDSLRVSNHVQRFCLGDSLLPFKQMNIMLGSTRYFTDGQGNWWEPDQVYRKSAWGSVGGAKFVLQKNGRLPYGTDKDILGTHEDPIYQTQQTGLRQYRFDVPPGKYELVLHFAELTGGSVKVPPYNLEGGNRDEVQKKRVFNVTVNGREWLHHFNIAKEYGACRAVVKSVKVIVNNTEGIQIDFTPVEGETILNAIQLKRL